MSVGVGDGLRPVCLGVKIEGPGEEPEKGLSRRQETRESVAREAGRE